ncbi:MAG: sigma-70 family RNA polymerase sigma factor [Planctomycetaceae bacterium]|jgi:RNA polymerase sigma factor (sigma-70 family)|nr:sigma-70 family RNA polymerase sigma factor [Planctomycetaceae bacterium]
MSKPSNTNQPLAAIWNRHGDQLRRRARTRLRQYGLSSQAESMDICNEVMADLARREQNQAFSADDALAYVLKAIDNQVLDTFRTLARQCRDFRRNAGTPIDDIGLSQRQSTPSQIALRRDVLDKIRSMLDEQDAMAVDLMLENRSWEEIGQRLGLKPDTVRMRVRRGLQRVREELGVGVEGDR